MGRVFFPAIIEGGAEPGYGVFFPDLDGLGSGGDSVQQAALNAEEGLRAHLELMAEEGLEIPKPSELDTITVDPDVKEVARILVPVDLPSTKVLRLNVTLPEDLVKRIDAAASNRSRFLADAAQAALGDGTTLRRMKVALKTKKSPWKFRLKDKPAKRRKTG